MVGVLLALIVLIVAAALSRGGRHPRLLRGGVAFALTSFLLVLAEASSPTYRMTSGEAYGIPLAIAFVVGLMPWARLVPLMKYPSALGLAVSWVAAIILFAYPVAIYMTWRFARGHRSDGRVAAAVPKPAPSAAAATEVTSGSKACPDCAEVVLVAARICRFCRYEFPAPEPLPDDEPAAAPVPPAATVAAPVSTAIAVAEPSTEPRIAGPATRRRTPGLLLPALFLVAVAVVSVGGVLLFRSMGAAARSTPIATQAPVGTAAPAAVRAQALDAGIIEFGTAPGREDCTIGGGTQSYSLGDPLYWTAAFSRTVEATEATKVRLYVDGAVAVDGNLERAEGSCLNGSVGAGNAVAGHYVLEYYVGSEVLARGEVDVVAR